jgi:fatty acid desaturase
LDFLRKQVLTARNVVGGWLTDVALGGLNHRIEHPLFPGMPSVHLGRAQPVVRVFYNETGLIQSWREALAQLYLTASTTVVEFAGSVRVRRGGSRASGRAGTH